jgi:hypothetical protein
MRYLVKVTLLILLIFGFTACDKDDEANNAQATSRMSVKLVDAPGDYDAVYIDVRDVVIKYQGSNEEVSIGAVNAGIYDLLELTGGVSVLLVDDELPSGNISQIRLILGDANTIVVDGQTVALNTPSAQQSGLKIQINETLEAGIFYEFILDFDVDDSIVAMGNGGYNLHPVIRANTVAESGSIAGNVLPIGIPTLITAYDSTEEISAYADIATGNFVLSGVPNGLYTVTVAADASAGWQVTVLENIAVINGSITALGTIILIP